MMRTTTVKSIKLLGVQYHAGWIAESLMPAGLIP